MNVHSIQWNAGPIWLSVSSASNLSGRAAARKPPLYPPCLPHTNYCCSSPSRTPFKACYTCPEVPAFTQRCAGLSTACGANNQACASQHTQLAAAVRRVKQQCCIADSSRSGQAGVVVVSRPVPQRPGVVPPALSGPPRPPSRQPLHQESSRTVAPAKRRNPGWRAPPGDGRSACPTAVSRQQSPAELSAQPVTFCC